ncbi:hypothetical protein EDC04DRAFT_1439271 [Pisolithus marmoratus]|nr:hypothetical protein EDC04DRAFT_1439271 [Pisolithus marmoratus]
MRFVSFVFAAFVAASSAQTITGPYSADAILALFGPSISKRQTTIPSECTPVCDPIANSTDTSDCPTSTCCTSTFIKSYHTCLGCVSKAVDGSDSTGTTKAAVVQLLTACIQAGALPQPPPTSQSNTKHNSYTEALSSQMTLQPSATEASATGSGVVAVPPVTSTTSSPSETSATSTSATPTSTNSAVRTTLGQVYSGIASVLIWAILQMM